MIYYSKDMLKKDSLSLLMLIITQPIPNSIGCWEIEKINFSKKVHNDFSIKKILICDSNSTYRGKKNFKPEITINGKLHCLWCTNYYDFYSQLVACIYHIYFPSSFEPYFFSIGLDLLNLQKFLHSHPFLRKLKIQYYKENKFHILF